MIGSHPGPGYSYAHCVYWGTVPSEPLLTAAGFELNDMIKYLPRHWYYWNDKKEWEDFELDELHFEPETVYNLAELGWFEWADCVWNEPLLFAYNKWKHTGDPCPAIILVED